MTRGDAAALKQSVRKTERPRLCAEQPSARVYWTVNFVCGGGVWRRHYEGMGGGRGGRRTSVGGPDGATLVLHDPRVRVVRAADVVGAGLDFGVLARAALEVEPQEAQRLAAAVPHDDVAALRLARYGAAGLDVGVLAHGLRAALKKR